MPVAEVAAVNFADGKASRVADRSPGEGCHELTSDRLDLGQFGHGCTVGEPAAPVGGHASECPGCRTLAGSIRSVPTARWDEEAIRPCQSSSSRRRRRRCRRARAAGGLGAAVPFGEDGLARRTERHPHVVARGRRRGDRRARSGAHRRRGAGAGGRRGPVGRARNPGGRRGPVGRARNPGGQGPLDGGGGGQVAVGRRAPAKPGRGRRRRHGAATGPGRRARDERPADALGRRRCGSRAGHGSPGSLVQRRRIGVQRVPPSGRRPHPGRSDRPGWPARAGPDRRGLDGHLWGRPAAGGAVAPRRPTTRSPRPARSARPQVGSPPRGPCSCSWTAPAGRMRCASMALLPSNEAPTGPSTASEPGRSGAGRSGRPVSRSRTSVWTRSSPRVRSGGSADSTRRRAEGPVAPTVAQRAWESAR